MASSARIDELRKKFEENPRRYFAPLANEYRKSGDIEQAISICREYLPQQPGHMSGHIVYGQALFEARQVEEARTVFETALSLDPENLIALRHLGDLALMVGDNQGAKTWYGRVLEADPRNEEIQAQLARIDQAPSLSPTPVANPAQTTTPPKGSPTPSSSAATVVLSAQRPAAKDTPPKTPAQGATTLEVRHDAVLPPTPPRPTPTQPIPAHSSSAPTTPIDLIGLETTIPLPAPPPTPSPQLEIERSQEAPPIGSFSLEGLETTSISSAPSPEPPHSPPAPEPPPILELADNVVPVAEAPPAPPAPAAVPEPVSELPFIEISEVTAAPPATPAPPPPSAEPAMADPFAVASAEPQAAPLESGPFVTETMAELYLRQGHRDEALKVYRALLEQRPGDATLEAKVAELSPAPAPEAAPVAVPEAAPVVAPIAATEGPTIRELLNAIAMRRPGAQQPSRDNGAPAQVPAVDVGGAVDYETSAVSLQAPVAEPVAIPSAPALVAARDGLSSLLGEVRIGAEDETAASTLARAFADVNGLEGGRAAPPTISGAPARSASNDLSLDSVFKKSDTPPATPSSFSFDQFFSARATSEHPTPRGSGAVSGAPESRDDVAQFTQWLEGLKKK